ncbi:MAG: DUF58 domain-containing protein, partial [Myxococcales bacterium]|nr:DUF58 domain-containing protein [Myxococcales bacterium]
MSQETSQSDGAARTLELLREIRRIEIQTSRLVNQHLAGSYQSVFKGQGVAFSEVRAYVPGDDVRAIDWNVTARTGEPHVKLFTEERELTVMLLVDMSSSLDLGTRDYDKRGLVARLAATFAFSAIRNNDRVGLIGFTDQVEVFVPPRSGRKHVLAVVSRVLTHAPRSRGTRPAAGLEYLARVTRGHSVAILISDFVPGYRVRRVSRQERREQKARERAAEQAGEKPIGEFERALKIARRRHDLIPIRVEDPVELSLPALGLVALEDLELLELGGEHYIDLSPRRAARYRERVASERERFDRLMRKLRLETLDIRCGDNWQ